jgi:hypothetical protein
VRCTGASRLLRRIWRTRCAWCCWKMQSVPFRYLLEKLESPQPNRREYVCLRHLGRTLAVQCPADAASDELLSLWFLATEQLAAKGRRLMIS